MLPRALPALAGALLLLAGTAAAAPPEKNALGLGVTALAPGGALDAGAGLALRYARVLHEDWVLAVALTVPSVDVGREAPPPSRGGRLDLKRLSSGLLYTFRPEPGGIRLAAGAGLDLVGGDGEGTFREPELGIADGYDVDTTLGYHLEVDARRTLGGRYDLLAAAGWLAADLDAMHRFEVSGVESAGTPVHFDLGGPWIEIGLAARF